MSATRKTCYCTAPLREDGTCRHGCDPALAAPGNRRRKAKPAPPSPRVGYLSAREVGTALARRDPRYRDACEGQRERMLRGTARRRRDV